LCSEYLGATEIMLRVCSASPRALACFQRSRDHRRHTSNLKNSRSFIALPVPLGTEPGSARHASTTGSGSGSPPPFAHDESPHGWIPRTERCLAAHPALSVAVFGASDAACVLGLSAALQAAQVRIEPATGSIHLKFPKEFSLP
jgi:hypothetical protein